MHDGARRSPRGDLREWRDGCVGLVRTSQCVGDEPGLLQLLDDAADGRAALQLYEAAAGTLSVRYPGRRVLIRPDLTGTYLDRNDLQILWWIENGVYVSLQQGGRAAGVRLEGRFPLRTLVRIAASTS